MLNNAVNRDDAVALVSLARRSDLRRRVMRRLGSTESRTRAAWDGREQKIVAPFEVPLLRERITAAIPAADGAHDEYERLAGWALGGRGDLRGLSVGCGYGSKERRWAATGRFVSLDAYDLSPDRIAHATRAAREHGLQDVLHFAVANSRDYQPARAPYDIVIVDSSLHHMDGLSEFIPRIRGWLADDGVFVLNEFVGPRRWQWSDEQLRVANGMLASLPDRYRMRFDGRPKIRVGRPSRLRMWIEDPSEAVESDLIVPLLDRHLRRVRRIDLPGTAVGLVLMGIAHHFAGSDPAARAHLERLLDEEAGLLGSGQLASDYVLATYTPH